jgi:uncharacterized protein (DUF1778 family)
MSPEARPQTNDTMLPVRLPSEVRAEIMRAAKREGRSLSGFLRFHGQLAAQRILASGEGVAEGGPR